jgi:hypothetical protein
MTAASTASRSGSTRQSASTRVSLDKLLPADVTTSLRQVALSDVRITPALLRDLDCRLGLREKHGVSTRRLRTYLGRARKEAGTVADANQTVPEQASAERAWSEALKAHRRRQASVASILDALFGRLADCDPDLWERRAYLMLLGLVYERLATNEDELSTDDLVALSKTLAEHRRIDARVHTADRAAGAEENAEGGEGQLPDRFADVVRQVYGTNFQNPA